MSAADTTSSPTDVASTLSADGHAHESATLNAIVAANRAVRVWTVVLDDDPTGTQTVRNVPVLTESCTDEDLQWALEQPGRTTFVLTNSRSVGEAAAEERTFEIVQRAVSLAHYNNLTPRIVSRSDSTLRGHFAAEVTAAHRALRMAGIRSEGTLFVPAFLEAGRVTANDVQWVRTAKGFIPAARTEYARDATFGYTEENLLRWVEERMGESGLAAVSLSLAELRAENGVELASNRIGGLRPDDVLVANAVSSCDLEVLMLGLTEQERRGRRPVIRCGPSFVRLCAGQHPSEPVTAGALAATSDHGIVVVGSHTALTNRQFNAAVQRHHLHVVELDADIIVHGSTGDYTAEIGRCAGEIVAALDSANTALRTSREVLTEGRGSALLTSKAIADALVQVVSRVAQKCAIGFLVAKGGITSSDIAVRALRVRRARVTGQVLPGTIPVWQLLDGIAPGLTYVVFPGNVGADDALAAVVTKLSNSNG
jgi:uncharacterized protein YgbK (DUF1537 family)